MPTLTLTTKYRKNTELVISPEELLAQYFYGLKIQSTDGTEFDRQAIVNYIKAAQEEISKFFDVQLFASLVTEKQDYFRDDYQNGFPFVRVSFPIRKILGLTGMLNSVSQMRYPAEWLQMRTSSKNRYYRQFAIVPNGSTISADGNVIFLGTFSYFGLRSFAQVENYWNIQYESGYLPGQIPEDIIQIISMLAAIPILGICGDIVLSTAGLSSTSLSIDGLSQSLSSKNGAFEARIKLYSDRIIESSKRIKNSYKGIQFVSL
jgi:hypothetical protein